MKIANSLESLMRASHRLWFFCRPKERSLLSCNSSSFSSSSCIYFLATVAKLDRKLLRFQTRNSCESGANAIVTGLSNVSSGCKGWFSLTLVGRH